MPEQTKRLVGRPEGGYRFLAVGECMVELAPARTAGEYRMGFAGDTFNTAWHLRQLRPDVDTGFFSRIGQDAVSQSMLDMMVAAGIDTRYVGRSAERSVGLYLITLDNGERSFSYWRDTSAARQLADDPAALAQALRAADIAYFSGISVAILDPAGRRALFEALAAARAEGRIVAFDPNLRPGLWASRDEMCAAITAAAGVSDMVLPSYDDEAVHFGDRDITATAERYLGAGARTVIVKNGAGPVLYVHETETGEVVPPKVDRIVDTTAAGDSFNAGVFASLDWPGTMADRIRYGARVAQQVIGQKGALVPVDPGAWPPLGSV